MIPTFPVDATIASIHLACLRIGRHQSLKSSIREVYGPNGCIHNSFGSRGNIFIERILAGTVDHTELIDRHTMFPMVASVLTQHAAERWRLALISGDSPSHRRYMIAMHHEMKKCDALRQCHECVLEDIHMFGTAHWHVMHQVQWIRFCKIHGSLLHDQCERCGKAFGEHSELSLPGEPCPHCGSSRTSSGLNGNHSMGYSAFSNAINCALQGAAPELEPGTRSRLLKNFIATEAADAKSLLIKFLTWWDVDQLDELNRLLRCRTSYRSALQIFSTGFAHVPMPFLIAVITFALEHSSKSDKCRIFHCEADDVDHLAVSRASIHPIEQLREELDTLARIHYFPCDVVKHLVNGNRSLAVNLIGGLNVFLLLDGLSASSRIEIKKCFEQPRPTAADLLVAKQLRQENAKNRIQVLRQNVQTLISNGCRTRSAIKSANVTLYQKALAFDRDWLDEVLPSKHRVVRLSSKANKTMLRVHYRARILQLMKNGFTTRTELRRESATACDFAIRNDTKWFERVVGPKKSGGKRKSA